MIRLATNSQQLGSNSYEISRQIELPNTNIHDIVKSLNVYSITSDFLLRALVDCIDALHICFEAYFFVRRRAFSTIFDENVLRAAMLATKKCFKNRKRKSQKLRTKVWQKFQNFVGKFQVLILRGFFRLDFVLD
ncbi:hypothetical protein M153_100013152 [Pseudoloma neurophilia]|uniref:Uncharacterized protein n=1 Tax=Pseudoloma neurophilia TaxID=146866 RepID=A0A0R0M1G1_9MICR|nr:hypothetical protein M153_100013152 [Pseudoloma neurophilia]